MRALVTGATGFIGSHLVERLLAEGLEVVCLARATSSRRWLADLPVTVRVAPLEDADALAEAVGDADVIFHSAGLTRARREADYLAVNADGTRRLLEAALKARPAPRRVVYVSSLSAAGPAPSDEPPDEDAPPRPLPGYGASKLAAERVVTGFADRLNVTVVRPPAVYGPRDTNFLPVFRMARRLGIAPILGRADNQLTFVYVADLVEGVALAGLRDAAVGRTYYLGAGTHSLEEFAEALSAALGKPLRRVRVPAWLARLAGEWGELKWTLTGRAQIISRRKVRDALQPRWTCSWSRAAEELGYLPRVDLFEGLCRTARWYEAAGWL